MLYLRKTFRQVLACIRRDMNTWFRRRLDDTRARSRRCLSYSCQSLPSQLLQYVDNVSTFSSDVCMQGRIQSGTMGTIVWGGRGAIAPRQTIQCMDFPLTNVFGPQFTTNISMRSILWRLESTEMQFSAGYTAVELIMLPQTTQSVRSPIDDQMLWFFH